MGAAARILRRWAVIAFMAMPALAQSQAERAPSGPLLGKALLRRVNFESLPGWKTDRHGETWRVFASHCRALADGKPELRVGLAADAALRTACREALELPEPSSNDQARRYFERLFAAHEILPVAGANPYDQGFLTGYYEPVVSGSLAESPEFREPVLGRPSDLVTLSPGDAAPDFPAGLSSARRMEDGRLEPYPVRREIESGAAKSAPTLLWVRDGIELFMMQVQGSARARMPDGRQVRLSYSGRNGQPYTSIGRLLVERGLVPRDEMSLARLKAWVRANGQGAGEAGRALLHENASYVFFSASDLQDSTSGPIGAAGLPLTRMRSIAVDRTLWSYGLPFWIEAELPWRDRGPRAFNRLMIAQDTGSAILGAARADLFFGAGARAGRLAGGIRHRARMFVLLPRNHAP